MTLRHYRMLQFSVIKIIGFQTLIAGALIALFISPMNTEVGAQTPWEDWEHGDELVRFLEDIKTVDKAPPGTQFYLRFKGYIMKRDLETGEWAIDFTTQEERKKYRNNITTIRFVLEGAVPDAFTGEETFRIYFCNSVADKQCFPFGKKHVMSLNRIADILGAGLTFHHNNYNESVYYLAPHNLLRFSIKARKKRWVYGARSRTL